MNRFESVIAINLLLLFNISCSRHKMKDTGDMLPIQDCFADRKVESKILNANGQMKYMLEKYFITTADSRFEPCDVPEKFMEEGLQVVFSGDVMQIMENERRAGTPLHLTAISVSKKE